MTKPILVFVFFPRKLRSEYEYRRRVPKPLLVAMELVCLARHSHLEAGLPDDWNQLFDRFETKWHLDSGSIRKYFRSDNYGYCTAVSHVDALIEHGFDIADILTAIKHQRLGCINKAIKAGSTVFRFNLFPVIRPPARPRWRRATDGNQQICP